jgi:hypothetical protein
VSVYSTEVRRVRLISTSKSGCAHTSYKQIILYMDFVKAVSRVVTISLFSSKHSLELLAE